MSEEITKQRSWHLLLRNGQEGSVALPRSSTLFEINSLIWDCQEFVLNIGEITNQHFLRSSFQHISGVLVINRIDKKGLLVHNQNNYSVYYCPKGLTILLHRNRLTQAWKNYMSLFRFQAKERRTKNNPVLLSRLRVLAICGIIFTQMSSSALAQTTDAPTLKGGTISINGIAKSSIGKVLYNAVDHTNAQTGKTTTTYAINRTDSSRIRLGIGDEITFSGTIEVPEELNLSWIRVDIYTTDTEQPYTAGVEYYREDNRNTRLFDLTTLPTMLIGSPIGKNKLCFEPGKEYILMISAGATAGGTFEDCDKTIDDIQGPAVILDVKHDPKTCVHPHANYAYIRHSSGEIRTMSYGDSYTHQLEPLLERYCGLCDSYIGNIWGQGTAQDHRCDEFGACVVCGYSPLVTLEDADYIISIPSNVTVDKSEGMTIRLDAIEEGDTIMISPKSANGGKLKMGEKEIPYSYDIDMVFSQAGEQTLNIVIDPADAIGLPPGTYTDTLTFDVSVERAAE